MAAKGRKSKSKFDLDRVTIDDCIEKIMSVDEVLAIYDGMDPKDVESLGRLPRGRYYGDDDGCWCLHRLGLVYAETFMEAERIDRKIPHRLFRWVEVAQRIEEMDPQEMATLRALSILEDESLSEYRAVIPFAASKEAQGCGPRVEGDDSKQSAARLQYEREAEAHRKVNDEAWQAWKERADRQHEQFAIAVHSRGVPDDIVLVDLDLEEV